MVIKGIKKNEKLDSRILEKLHHVQRKRSRFALISKVSLFGLVELTIIALNLKITQDID